MGNKFSSDDPPPLPKPPGFPEWPDLVGAFRSGLASQTNREIIARFKPICEKFSAALKATLEAHNSGYLRVLGILAELYRDDLDKWIDAVLPYGQDSNLLILRDYWAETAEDITAALKRVKQEEAGSDDDDPSEAWKKK